LQRIPTDRVKKQVSITFHRSPFVRCFVRSLTSNLCTAVTRYNTVESYVFRNKINSPSYDKTAAQPNVFRLLVLSIRRSTCTREITTRVIDNFLITPHYFSHRFQLKCLHGDALEGRGNWRMQWVASTLHTTSEHGVSSFTTVDAHTSAASSRLN